jgi:hypothetical protein
MTRIDALTTSQLTELCSPKISHLDSYRMCIFGIRICSTEASFSTGTWLANDFVKSSLAKHNVEINISNSTCDSGRMVTAGAILLKHPTYTHRLYYLLSLRKQLPLNTPFFDIGIHQRTSNGIASPHLVVKCGENHQEALTEILSDSLDGKQTTAIYIGNKILQSMTQEASEELFDTHQQYVDAVQRLPLSPQIVNIDRTRTEYGGKVGDPTRSRSARAWANSIHTHDGKSLQCDAENGGKDKKAYLLVPKQSVMEVQQILQQYKNSIRVPRASFNLSEGTDRDRRPDEIDGDP